MNERDFVYWLNGFLEVGNPKTLNATQVKQIKDHLKLVMKKETPPRVRVRFDSDFARGYDKKLIC